MSGHFSLAHDQFEATAANTVKGLLKDEHFADVTLTCSDGKYVKAHKVILSSYSSTLKNILLSVQQQHPVIYLKGVNYDQLRSIVNFIYLGETKVDQHSFVTFMELNVAGLATDSEDYQTETIHIKES